tara:strand:- start:884 stop:1780 length:897 start_codon:yes stop_codon:yes gene_type:complete
MTVKYIITYDRWLLAPELSHMISQAPECNPMPSYVDTDTGYRVTPHHYCSHLFDWPYDYYNMDHNKISMLGMIKKYYSGDESLDHDNLIVLDKSKNEQIILARKWNNVRRFDAVTFPAEISEACMRFEMRHWNLHQYNFHHGDSARMVPHHNDSSKKISKWGQSDMTSFELEYHQGFNRVGQSDNIIEKLEEFDYHTIGHNDLYETALAEVNQLFNVDMIDDWNNDLPNALHISIDDLVGNRSKVVEQLSSIGISATEDMFNYFDGWIDVDITREELARRLASRYAVSKGNFKFIPGV